MGPNMNDSVIDGILRSKCFVAFLTKGYLKKIQIEGENCKYEFDSALKLKTYKEMVFVNVKKEGEFTESEHQVLKTLSNNNPKYLSFHSDSVIENTFMDFIGRIRKAQRVLQEPQAENTIRHNTKAFGRPLDRKDVKPALIVPRRLMKTS